MAEYNIGSTTVREQPRTSQTEVRATRAYDQYGNMTCQQNGQTQGLCPQYSFSSSTNRITSSGYTYDASGDLTADGTHTYQYDAEGRLISVDNGSTASYVYNALGERVEKDVGGAYTEYAFDKDGEPEAENNRGTTNGGWIDSWVYFEGQHIAHFENGGVYYIYSNQVGTAGFVTDWTGAVVQDELHYPWGQVWTTMGTQTEERFASLHHRDSATNLDPTHFRMYSSDEGRWLTPDPAQADIFRPQSMSLYAYAAGNPFSIFDPLGLGCEENAQCVNVYGQMPPPIPTSEYPGCVAHGTEGCIQPPCGVLPPGVAGCAGTSYGTPYGGGAPGGNNFTKPAPKPAPPTIPSKIGKFVCKGSPSGAVLAGLEHGAAIGAARGAVFGFWGGEAVDPFGGGIGGVLLGGFSGGVIGGAGGIFSGSVTAIVCSLHGSYKE